MKVPSLNRGKLNEMDVLTHFVKKVSRWQYTVCGKPVFIATVRV